VLWPEAIATGGRRPAAGWRWSAQTRHHHRPGRARKAEEGGLGRWLSAPPAHARDDWIWSDL